MNTGRFDKVIHPQNRLQICAILATAEAVEFSSVRTALGLSDSVLSKQITILEEAGYVDRAKVKHDLRRRTWIALTARGREAFEGHLAELRRIVNSAASTADQPGDQPRG
jgi:DNA-binding MarR family transcriptional regulator